MLNRLELKVPPVALVIVTGALMWAVARVASPFSFRVSYRDATALGLVVGGLIVSLLGVVAFKRAQTTVNPMTPEASSSLVIAGIYRRTRNPMYLGFALALAGWATFLSNALAFALLPGFVLYMNRFQIRPEEVALQSRFGEDFLDYARRVGRWL